MCFKKEILKASEKGVHMSQKMSCLERPSWLNWELCLDRKKRRIYGLWKKRQATSENYKNAMKSCREKI